ncbi:DNA repair protein RAD51 homolog 2-like isoform X2 [Empidonax traillii]|uniref:DNA repair protein RAD51 homolog 2-like isoform X2 n=1 Tax=Empidonax traillii TaxID=164674 RepID=UPI000FFD9B13|nr:DNA repair protein RAD51 homolog 2-like isoform X2 [Empidonax traillii]
MVVILTNQITTSLSSGPAIQADLVSPADDLSLSEVLVPNGMKTLKELSSELRSPQRSEAVGASISGKRDSGCVTAALGNTWSHSVNTRLILQYHDLPKRQLLIAKSPVAPFSAFFYTIEKSGLVLQGLFHMYLYRHIFQLRPVLEIHYCLQHSGAWEGRNAAELKVPNGNTEGLT